MDENNHPGEGLDLDREDQYGEEEERSPRKRGFFVKIAALLVLTAFIFSSAPELSFILGDRLGFLQQNQVLRNDQIVQMVKPAVVGIEAVDASNPVKTVTHSGTGFNVDPSGIIVTNEHIVSGSSTITITFESGQKFYANRYEPVTGYDLVIIRLDSASLPAVDIDIKALPPVGDTVTIIGNPLGFQKIAQRGKISSYNRSDSSRQSEMIIQLPINPGNSGSPVINEQAQVVGIIYGSISVTVEGESEPMAVAIPARVLADRLP